jgi:predicted metal-dependent peptidase
MPLVEPPETREEKRIEDFVIAVDTSMSTSGELVRQFLACTYAILRSTETFTRKVNIRILQCDDQIRKDTVIHDLEELKTYMAEFELCGGSATDFRPVFEHVNRLQKEGAFTSLRGLVYFTDGMGIYPKKRPSYDAAFILLEEPPLSVQMPPWAIRLVLALEGLEKAARETAEEYEIDLENLPQL